MSRIGKKEIEIPSGVTVSLKDSVISVKGKLGELSQTLSAHVSVEIEGNMIRVSRSGESKPEKAHHGLMRSLIANMVQGVSEGFKIELELVGVGYRASNQGQKLDLSLGYSHNIILEVANEVKVETISEKSKNPLIVLTSHDKQLVGMVAAKIRSLRKTEPYKGKGVRFRGEVVRKKAGKTA